MTRMGNAGHRVVERANQLNIAAIHLQNDITMEYEVEFHAKHEIEMCSSIIFSQTEEISQHLYSGAKYLGQGR